MTLRKRSQSRRLCWLTCACAALITATAALIVAQAQARAHPPYRPQMTAARRGAVPPRELWIWHQHGPRALAALARRYSVTDLLVWVPPGFTARPATLGYLSALRSRAAAAGLHLTALGGDPSWAANPPAAAAWAREVSDSKLFAGLHLDIEPYALPSWATRRAALVKGLLAALAACKSTGLPAEADIPYWYNTIKTSDGQDLDAAILRRTSGVTIMAYRNRVPAVLSVAAAEMRRAGRLGKPAWLGVNTAPPGADPADTSFFGQPDAAIGRAITALNVKAQRWPAFAGLALEDYQSVAALRQPR